MRNKFTFKFVERKLISNRYSEYFGIVKILATNLKSKISIFFESFLEYLKNKGLNFILLQHSYYAFPSLYLIIMKLSVGSFSFFFNMSFLIFFIFINYIFNIISDFRRFLFKLLCFLLPKTSSRKSVMLESLI